MTNQLSTRTTEADPAEPGNPPAELRQALRHDGLELHYQPIIADGGTVVAAEALVRWPHRRRGLLGADVVLAVAERDQLLAELDRWVLRTACTEAATWPHPHGRPISVAINLTGLTPDTPDFVDDTSKIIAESGMPSHHIILELAETTWITAPGRAGYAMQALAWQGVRFAFDDFGTGHSTLARMRKLPAQIIKLDREFVAGLDRQSVDRVLVRTVAELAQALGLQCIAEGVETIEQLRALRELGVTTFQGWLFGAALPAHQLRAFLTEAHTELVFE